MKATWKGLIALITSIMVILTLGATAACGSYDHKEPLGSVHQSFECTGAKVCTEAEQNLSCYDSSLGITLVCFECVIVEAKAVGLFHNPNCHLDAGTDAAPDAVADAAIDTTPDVGPDATPDAAPDAVADVTPDVQPEVGPDAAPDAAPDAVVDAADEADVAADVTPDVLADVTPDVTDATADVAADVIPDVLPDVIDAAPDAEACAEQLGAPCPVRFAYACGNTLRCSCTNLWSDPATTSLYTCSCHGGELCSLYGWTEGKTCTEAIPGGDGASWTLQCQCNVMLQQGSGVVCVSDAGTDSGTDGAVTDAANDVTSDVAVDGAGGSDGSPDAVADVAADVASDSAGGSGGAADAAADVAVDTGSDAAGGSGGSLNNPSTLPPADCVQSNETASPAALPATGLWLKYTAPGHGSGTWVAEYDWTDYFVPGFTDTIWQVRTVAPNSTTNDIFVSLIDSTSYARYFQPKVVAPETVSDCHIFHNDGYFCTSTSDDAQSSQVYCLGTWTVYKDNVQIATYTDAPGSTPTLPILKTIQKYNGFWSPKIGYQHP